MITDISRRFESAFELSQAEVVEPDVRQRLVKHRARAVAAFLVVSGWLVLSSSGWTAGMSFAGVPLTPGATVRANVPLSDLEKSYVQEGGNAVPPHTVAVLAVPSGFDPRRNYRVLVVFSTSDFQHQNRDDLVKLYRPTALAQDWVLLAGDGPAPANKLDSSGWRAGHTLAALDALHRSFPGSKNWPIACAGYSGGAKRAGLLAPLLAVGGYRICGLFLTGINDDTASEGYRQYKPGTEFLRTPIFLSTGAQDAVATPLQQNSVRLSMQRTGFSNVRHEIFPYGHVVKKTHIEAALRWFAGK